MKKALDSITILRFTKAFRRGGGVESHLNDLDTILLNKNEFTIIRLYLDTEPKNKAVISYIGKGKLIEFPMHVAGNSVQDGPIKKQGKLQAFNKLNLVLREKIIYNPILFNFIFKRIFKRYIPSTGIYGIKNAGKLLHEINLEQKVNLLVMHHLGTVDSLEMINESAYLKIPFVFINHFSNDRFYNISIREQIKDAAGIAGVTGIGVPKRLKNIFENVSDGIDTEIFNPENIRPLRMNTNIPTIIYPARIARNKGQKDLILAYANLKKLGVHARIVFAGRIDSNEYENELRKISENNGLTDDILLIGQLNREELRDWYGISSVMAFPTYHQEGLPRILIEAQAMKVPPVVYNIGGTSEGVLNGKTGYVVPKGDLKKLTQRLYELLTDEEKRDKMGEAGRVFIQNKFSLNSLAERHKKLYLKYAKM